MNSIKEAEAIIKQYAERQAEKKSNPAEEAERAADIAKTAMKEALEGADLNAYQAAKAEYKEARDLIEFYNNRADRFITDEKYQNLCAGIHTEVDALNATAAKKVMTLLKEMNGIKSQLSSDLGRADAALYKLQHNVNECRDMPAYKNGWTAKCEEKTLQDRDYSLLWFLSTVMEKAEMYDCFKTDHQQADT